jgi:type 1 glutamine amidotransferase
MRIRSGIVLTVALIAASTFAAIKAQPANKKVLYITYSAGFRHDVIPLSMELLPQIGKKNGFDVVATKDLAFLSAVSLPAYDAVIFYTTGELPVSDADKANFLTWIKSGKGFIGIHSATDTFYKWPEYGEMIGGYFDGHPWHQQVNVKVEDSTHPATRHLPAVWTLNDEIYQYRNWDRS